VPRSRSSDAAPPRALVVVRNGVTHDARVLRTAHALRDAGLQTLVLGVQTATERRARSVEGGMPVVRIDPLGRERAALRRLRGARNGASGDSSTSPPRGDGGAAGPRQRSALRRAAVSAGFLLEAVRVVLRTRPRIVHCNDHNTMWVGVAAKLTGARVVYDSHELWPDRNGRPEWRPRLIAEEALFVRVADRVVTTSPGYADVLAARYRVARPLIVRNVPTEDEAARVAPRETGDAVAVYVGGLLRGRGLEQAIDALALVEGLGLRLIGPGAPAYRVELLQRARERGVADRVEVRDPVAPHAVIAELRGATMGLALIQPVCLSYELTLPNKLFEYAAAGLPMVVSDLPVMAGVVREWDCGVLTRHDDLAAIAVAMKRLCAPCSRRSYAEAATRLGRAVTWERERGTLLALYSLLAAGGRPV